jgi:rubrerythrin
VIVPGVIEERGFMMFTDFNANEVFQVGVEIERNGMTFYETAAAQTGDRSARELFDRLAKWECQHIQLFEDLRRRLPDSAKQETIFDPEGEVFSYIKTTAQNHVFVKNKDAALLAGQCKSPQEILDIALTFEKDSIAFYTAMRKAVPEALGRKEVDRLIDEEIQHVALLGEWKEKLPGCK